MDLTKGAFDVYPSNGAATSSVPPAAATAEPATATCPICCGDLASNREEVGALTYHGRRIEPELYHLGCITMMLTHQGSIRAAGRGGAEARAVPHGGALGISWGVSPVTRKPVDNFMPLPQLDDRRRWVEFIDWRCDGRLDVTELATAIGAMLPVDERAMDAFLRENFNVDEDGVMSAAELEHIVLPYLEEHCEEVCQSRARVEKRRVRARADLLLRCLEDHSARSRRVPALGGDEERGRGREVVAAAEAFGEVAEQGDPRAINAVTSLLEDRDADVRLAASALIPRVVARGDQQAFEVLCARLQHWCGCVRQCIVEAVGQVAYQGDQRAIDEVSFLLGDRDPAVRRTTVQVLSDIAEKGNQGAIQAVAYRLEDVDAAVRCAVVQALAQIAEKGDLIAIGAILCGLADGSAAVRRASLAALAQIANRGDAQSFMAARSLLEDEDAAVQREAVVAVATIAQRGDRQVLEGVMARLGERDPGMRAGAVRALAHVAATRDRRAIKAVCLQLDDETPQVRRAALEVLGQIGDVSDRRVAQAVSARLQDSDLSVRRAAEQALAVVRDRRAANTPSRRKCPFGCLIPRHWRSSTTSEHDLSNGLAECDTPW